MSRTTPVRRPFVLSLVVALPALLAGCTGTLDAALPVGEAEAAHAGFDCPPGEFVVGFDGAGRPKCRLLGAGAAAPVPLDECGYGEIPIARGGGYACSPWLEFVARMQELEGAGAVSDVHDHAPGSITALMLEGGLDAQVVDPTQIQLRVSDECAQGEAMMRIHENGAVDCAAIASGAGGATDPALVQSRISGDCAVNTFVQRVHQDGTVDCGSVVGPSGNGAVQTTDLADGAVTPTQQQPNIAEVRGRAVTLLNTTGGQKLAMNATITVPQGATPHKVLVLATLRASCRYCPAASEIRVFPSFTGTLRVGTSEAWLWLPADPEANGQAIPGHKAPRTEATLAFVQNVYGGSTTLELFATHFPVGQNVNFQPPRPIEPSVEVASLLVFDLGVA